MQGLLALRLPLEKLPWYDAPFTGLVVWIWREHEIIRADVEKLLEVERTHEH